MKRIFTLPGTMLTLMRRTTSGIHFSAICLAIFIVAGMPVAGNAQQFVKTYSAIASCSGTGGNLRFATISKSKIAGHYYIAGTQDASIYMCEVDDMGVILQEKLIDLKNSTCMLRSMITDDDGNIVIVGTTFQSGYKAFLMKLSPTFNILLHRTYNANLTGNYRSTFFGDVKDNKLSGEYYICGGWTSNPNTNQETLITVDRNTGSINNTTSGIAVGGGASVYDALVFATNQPLKSPEVIATGILSTGGLNKFRPWINRHNSNLSLQVTRNYIIPDASEARIYSLSLLRDGDSILHCWQGDITANLDAAKNAGVTKCGASTLLPGWQKEYTLTPAAQARRFFTKIDTARKGYVVEGNWWDNTTRINIGPVGEMILLRLTSDGNPIWSRKIRDVYVNSGNHNSSFVTDGTSIFTVGFKMVSATSANTTGVLVKIPIVNGALDLDCSVVQTVGVKSYSFSESKPVINVVKDYVDQVNYYALNCTKTNEDIKCDICLDVFQLPSANFDLAGKLSGTSTKYDVTASAFATSPNSKWIVSEVDLTTGLDVSNTVYTSFVNGFWGANNPTNFGGYLGGENTGTISNFQQNRKYRFRHILSYTNNCGITKSDTVTKSIFICPSCKPSKEGSLLRSVTTENESVTGDALKIIPNPVTGSIITLEFTTKTTGAVTVKIVDMHGRQVAVNEFSATRRGLNRYSINTKQLTNGTYTMLILSEGKTTTQKFVVAK